MVMTVEGEMDGRMLLLEESGVDIVISEVTVSRRTVSRRTVSRGMD
jgi:hypothetical protein